VNAGAFNTERDAEVNGRPGWLHGTAVTASIIASDWTQHVNTATPPTTAQHWIPINFNWITLLYYWRVTLTATVPTTPQI